MCVLSGCESKNSSLFQLVPPSESLINFENTLQEDEELNIINYDYLYNGGGVALADLNNDGLCDIYFSGNAVPNRLYMNKGDFAFTDVTDKAGVSGRQRWKTGVTIADVNGDGWLDIYVCYSGPVPKEELTNQLFINNGSAIGGVPSFTESAKAYGLDAPYTFSTQASFFDFDRDNDLDMFLLNHVTNPYYPFYNTSRLRTKRHPQYGNRLYRNDGGRFVDISVDAGIHGGGLNYGLSVAASDLNNDGWIDIYVTNDYEEQDYCYLNNKDGTFLESSKLSFGHFSMYAMGCDAADYNNDGRTDIFVADMLPEDNQRQKLLKGPHDYTRYHQMVDSGFHHQNMRNTLQVNRGIDKHGVPQFSEIGQLAGVSNTDWSWAPLLADFDNDGWKDLFVSNGFLRDYTNRDFLKFAADISLQNARKSGDKKKVFDAVREMPSSTISNYIFRNKRDLTFDNATNAWGLNLDAVSSGAAYGDLDNDGDLDLVVNNINAPAHLWRNTSEVNTASHFLRIRLIGVGLNSYGVGSKVHVSTSHLSQMQELVPTRGFQSSVDYTLHFGIGNDTMAKNVFVKWPDGSSSTIKNVKADTLLIIDYKHRSATTETHEVGDYNKALFVENSNVPAFQHKEDPYVDFDDNPLLPYTFSTLGPCLGAGTIDSKGARVVYVGGSPHNKRALYMFEPSNNSYSEIAGPWLNDSMYEDLDAVLFDADGDKDNDLYVASGGNQHKSSSIYYQDRLYINIGNRQFRKSEGQVPRENISGSCVEACDYDRDGDIDLFVGGLVKPDSFPLSPESILLENDGRGHFKKKLNILPREGLLGMVRDAKWADVDNDQWPDLVLAGEWMPLTILLNANGKFSALNNGSLQRSRGLWSSLAVADFDKDGDIDIVAGNAGTNLQWHPNDKEPMELYYGTYAENGKILPLMCAYVQGVSYPVPSLDELADQIPSVKKKFNKYKDYANGRIDDIISTDVPQQSNKLTIDCLESSVFINEDGRNFSRSALPVEAQFSCINTLLINDFNRDGHTDILTAGNTDRMRVQDGMSDASFGLLLTGNSKGQFIPQDHQQTGFIAKGQARNMVQIDDGKYSRIVLAVNNDQLKVFSTNQ